MKNYYRKAELSQDTSGYFRNLGKFNGTQQKFRLGWNKETAEVKALKIETLFREAGQQWTAENLADAKSIAKGQPSRQEQAEHLRNDWGMDLPGDQPELYQQVQRYPAEKGNANLHMALDAYIAHLTSTQADESGWGRVKVRQAMSLKEHHADFPLAKLTLDRMEQMLDVWVKRPAVKDKNKIGKQISKLTARNQIKQLRDFWKWLHRSEQFSWKRPDGWEDLRGRAYTPRTLPSDAIALIQTVQVQTYSADEIKIILANATPLVRAFVLLGLNCGFSIAEISTLSVHEIHLAERHPHYGELGDYIRRVRLKSGVYGEWKLWPETVEAIQWAFNRRQEIKPSHSFLFTTESGLPYNARTASGNKPNKIPSLWNNLHKKLAGKCRKLAFKFLRKTSGDMVRRIADGETMGIHLTHGHPVKSDTLADIYTNRPFDKVFAATDMIRKQLFA